MEKRLCHGFLRKEMMKAVEEHTRENMFILARNEHVLVTFSATVKDKL